MRLLNGEIWVSYSELTQVGVKPNTLNLGINRGSGRWQSVKDPDDGRSRIFRYSSLGNAYKDLVRQRLCGNLEPAEFIALKESAEAPVVISLSDRLQAVCEQGYFQYLPLYRDLVGLTDKQLRSLARTAGCLDEIIRWRKENNVAPRSYEGLEEAARFMADASDYFPKYGLPTNAVRLKPYVKAVEVEGKTVAEAVRPRNLGNANRAKFSNDPWWQAVAVHLRASGRNLAGQAIIRKMNELAPLIGKEAPSDTTVRNFFKGIEHLTGGRWDLGSRHLARYRSSMPMSLAMYANDCWMMDGTRVQLGPHQTPDGKAGFLYVVVVMDVYSGAYLGWHFSYSESGHAYRMALKMAVTLTGSLPYELRHDRFPGHNREEMENLFEDLKHRGVKLTKTSVATGKARVERAFYTLQQVFESEHFAYIGQGIRSSTAFARPTEAYLKAVLKECRAQKWDFDAVWMAECQILDNYNSTPLNKYSTRKLDISPLGLYEAETERPNSRPVELWDLADLFWPKRLEGIRNNKITLTVSGQKFTYELGSEHYTLLSRYQRKDVKVRVAYQLSDLSEVMVYDSETGEYLGTVRQFGAIQTYGPDAEWDRVADYKADQKAIAAKRKAEADQYLQHLPAEAAMLLPTSLPKAELESAQSSYLLATAGEWKAETDLKKPVKATPKAEKAPQTSNEPLSINELIRAQW